MQKVTINDNTIEVPNNWNHLPLKKQLYCYAILLTDTKHLLSPQEVLPAKKIMLMQALLDMDDDYLKLWKEDCLIVDPEMGETIFNSEVAELSKIADCFFDRIEPEQIGDPETFQIKLGLTKNPFPEIERKKQKKKYYGPADELENLTIAELGDTFTFFENFLKTNDEDWANKLIATLYRPAKQKTKANKQSAYGGDIRQPYIGHEAMVKKRKEKVKLLPPPVKQLIIFWFASCRQHIINSYQNIFVAPEGEQAGNNYGWGGVIMSLADGLQNIDAVAAQPANTALIYLSYLEDQRKKAELRATAK